MALIGREFADTVQFRSPPPATQKMLFAMMGTYPQLSRSLMTPEEPESTPVGTARSL